MQDPLTMKWVCRCRKAERDAWYCPGQGKAGCPVKGSKVKLERTPPYSLRWFCFLIFNFFTQEDKRASREIWAKRTMCKEY